MADLDIEIVANIEGLDELEEAFTGGSRRAIVKFLRKVEMKAAKVLVKSAEQYAPYRTGDLEADICVQSKTNAGEGTLTVRVGPSQQTFYGLIQEVGDATVPATHWLENSARAVQDEVLEVYCEACTDGLEAMKKG